jgi:tetratricopeptide (TPR) repeat protein
VAQLKVTLLGDVPKVEETDPQAYSLFLQARHLDRQFTPESMSKAVDLYQQALTIAPDYAAAWSGLSRTYNCQIAVGQLPLTEGSRMAREAANRALAIDPDYAPAHGALAEIASNQDNDLAVAANHLGRALTLAPTDPEILRLARDLTQSLGRLDEAIVLGEYVIARDPVDATAHFRLGLSYQWSGRSDAAVAQLRKALALSPDRISGQYQIGMVLLLGGEPEAALSAFEQEETDEEYRVKGTALALHDLGRQAEFETAFSELRERWGEQWPSEIAHVYAWTGDADAAFEWLDKSVAQNEDGLIQQFLLPQYAPLHDDPRWLAFRERTGTSEAQLAAIEFEVAIPE